MLNQTHEAKLLSRQMTCEQAMQLWDDGLTSTFEPNTKKHTNYYHHKTPKFKKRYHRN